VGQRRAVGGEVVGQVLAEHRPRGGDGAGVRRAALRGVAEPAGPADGPQQPGLDRQGRQLREQACITGSRPGCAARPRLGWAVAAYLAHGATSRVSRPHRIALIRDLF
jgi:hypothetical protein